MILSFNQERFIEETIAAAFSQDYPGLEVLISDDGSRDGTWERIQAKVASYTGPYRVRARQEAKTQGTLAHLLHAATDASGELLVLSAGDDISYPQRTRRIVERWMETDAVAFASRHDVIDVEGELLHKDVPGIAGRQVRRWTGMSEGQPLVKGCTSAYARSFLESIPTPAEKVLHEDIAASLWLVARDLQCVRIEEVLVAYRRHDSSVSFRSFSNRMSAILAECRREQDSLKWYVALYVYLLTAQVPSIADASWQARVRAALEASKDVCEFQIGLLEGGLGERLAALIKAPDAANRRFAWRRVLGPRFLALQKYIWRALRNRECRKRS